MNFFNQLLDKINVYVDCLNSLHSHVGIHCVFVTFGNRMNVNLYSKMMMLLYVCSIIKLNIFLKGLKKTPELGTPLYKDRNLIPQWLPL